MGWKDLLGLSTKHEGQHRPGKHTAQAKQPREAKVQPKKPKSGDKK